VRVAPKVALSLLISTLVFAGIAVAAYAGLFSLVETRLYQPSVIANLEGQLAQTALAVEEFHAENISRFSAFLNEGSVRRSLLPNQSRQDIFDREVLAANLVAEVPGLAGIRIIDSGDAVAGSKDDRGIRRIHFSTYPADVLKKESFLVSYQSYGSGPAVLPYARVAALDGSAPRVVVDPERDLFLYCFPFQDAYSTYRGTAVFALASRAVSQRLVSLGLSRLSDTITPIADAEGKAQGFLRGAPAIGKDLITDAVVARWLANELAPGKLIAAGSGGWVLISRKSESGFAGQLAEEDLFVFPKQVRVLFLAVCFLTLFLLVFLLLNFRQDDLVVVRNRVRRFQIQLINEFMEKGEEVDWEEIGKSLSYRRHDVNAEIKKGFGKRLNKRHGAEIDALLDRSWDEIIAAIGQHAPRKKEIGNADEIRALLEQVLQNNAITLNIAGAPAAPPDATAPTRAPQGRPSTPPASTVSAASIAEAESIPEDLEELEELDEIAELDEVPEELAASDADGAPEEIEELEELDEIAEAAEVEEIGEAEELAEAETDDIVELEAFSEEERADESMATPTQNAQSPASEIPVDEIIDAFGDIVVEPFEPEVVSGNVDEVEYLEAEWEPDLLEVATEDELNRFVEETFPDQVLVYDFHETPGFDSRRREGTVAEAEPAAISADIKIAGLDFSDLDRSLEADASEAEEIPPDAALRVVSFNQRFADCPAVEELAVVGDEEPEELVDEAADDADRADAAIVSEDGLYLVSHDGAKAPDVDRDFKSLVDSVLR